MQNHLSIQLCIASIFYLICDQINCHYRRRQHTISTVYTTPLLWTSCCNCRECSSLTINWWILLRAPASSTANCVIAVSFGTIFLGVPWATPLTALNRGVVQRVTLYPLGRQILETSFRSITDCCSLPLNKSITYKWYGTATCPVLLPGFTFVCP